MNRKIILTISLILLAGIVGLVLASEIESGIAIFKGWNLIYGFTPSSLYEQGFDFSHIKAIYTYIPQEGKYVRIYPVPESTIIEKYGDAYFEKQANWVYSDATVEGELNGRAHFTEYWLEEPLPLSQKPLYKGWNFVGVTSYIAGKPQGEIIGDCNFEKMYVWDFVDQKWVNWPINKNEDIENDWLGYGLIIKVSNDCKISSSNEEVTNPPSLPEEQNNVILGRKCTTNSDCPNQYTDWSCKNGTTAQRYISYYSCEQEKSTCQSSPGGVEYENCANGCLNSVCN